MFNPNSIPGFEVNPAKTVACTHAVLEPAHSSHGMSISPQSHTGMIAKLLRFTTSSA